METLASITDKLIIESIKIVRLRDKLENDKTLNDNQKIELFNIIEMLNRQRSELQKELDELVDDWFNGKKVPKTFKRIKF